ncbi:FAD-dependent oxidoreductase [Tamlana nanhaiensis]|uniref:FAD-dependent oxidoreductase n=1 Tax=Neotamlana nanhaiensis TaxID=1382798 RepID=A0A0D7W2W4_9FLAO|nr:FAD-binding oxidoreductase [Tamlana nanhaiensis]KJD32187.1 FAD-dependent oxidoreductase [Tamlana nanhaiensis]KJD32349.1 FAD-dependent oxidoreductase [Tamlana nanhaiensis]
MKQVDYIIVGSGIAGVSFCEQLKANNKTFVVFDDASQKSSVVAGGLYNPVVLRRFTSVWKSKEQLDLALPMYAKIEKRLQIKLDYKLPVYRKFASTEEQNDWFTASDKPLLAPFLSTKLVKNTNETIKAPFGFGEVLHSGKVDVKTLIDAYKEDLFKEDLFFEEAFNYEAIQFIDSKINYKQITANHIVFAEGYGLKSNPFFNYLPLVGTKGELVTIYAPKINIDFVLKSGVFLIPLGDHLYTVGATYEWKDTSYSTTEKAKLELTEKLKKLINCEYKVVNQVAGMRPTVIDRRPLVGTHHKHKNLHVLNGLGTRGVMIGPYAAKQLYNFIENQEALNTEINIARFTEAD